MKLNNEANKSLWTILQMPQQYKTIKCAANMKYIMTFYEEKYNK
jgi:hypothetical protein